MMTRLLVVGLLLAAPTLGLLPKCASDLDCSLNGICDKATGVCACDEPWTSNLDGADSLPACGFLRFSSAGSPNDDPSQSPAGVYHGVTKSWTSWGASVVRGTDKRYHAFIAEMANECGLGTWQQNSQVVHAVAATPAGPFERIDVVVPPLSHNPQVMIAPDGTAVIYTLFDGWSAGVKNCNRTLNGSAAEPQHQHAQHTEQPAAAAFAESPGATEHPPPPAPAGVGSGGVGNCTVIPGDTSCNPGPCWQCTITMHASSDLNAPGPWQSYRTQIIGLANNNGIPNYNPTAIVLKNGSIALMIHDKDQWSGLSIALAATWKGPYRITVPDARITTCTQCLEDPFMWVDKRGHWHALVHKMFDPKGQGPLGSWSGGHLYSVSGTQWEPLQRAYNTTFSLLGGESVTMQRRERPKLLADPITGVWRWLYNGVISADGKDVYSAVAELGG